MNTVRAVAGFPLLAAAALCIFLATPASGTGRLRAVLAGDPVGVQVNPLHAAGLLLAAAACALFLSRREG